MRTLFGSCRAAKGTVGGKVLSMFDDADNPSGLGLTRGAKIAILVAIPFVLFGLYLLFAPISDLRTTSGAVFNCGSAINPASDKWHSNICGDINRNYLFKGMASVLSGLLIAGGGFFLFGSSEEENEYEAARPVTRADDDEDVEPAPKPVKKARTRTFD